MTGKNKIYTTFNLIGENGSAINKTGYSTSKINDR